MRGYVIAMEEEAKPFIEYGGFKQLANLNGYKFYSNKNSRLIVSGIGMINASIVTMMLIRSGCSEIINIGTCGAYNIKPHTIVENISFYQGDFDLRCLGINTKDPCNTSQENTNIGYSMSHFADDGDINLLSTYGESRFIIDMEGYGIQSVCRKFNVDSLFFKVVSDSGDFKEFKLNLDSVFPKQSVDYIFNKVDKFCNRKYDLKEK